jgi:lysophospholipase L1-like esterase
MAIPATPTTTISGSGTSTITGAGKQTTAAPSIRWILLMGDSKTAPNPNRPDVGSDQTWAVPLVASLASVRPGTWRYYNAGVGSVTVATYLSGIAVRFSAAIDSSLGFAAPFPATGDIPAAVLINLGINDAFLGQVTSQATWQANYLAIIDYVRAKWATAPIYVMRWWARNLGTDADTMNGWIPALIALRSNCFLGPDERVFYKGADDGVTNTYDGIHQNTAGHLATAAAWMAVLP